MKCCCTGYRSESKTAIKRAHSVLKSEKTRGKIFDRHIGAIDPAHNPYSEHQ